MRFQRLLLALAIISVQTTLAQQTIFPLPSRKLSRGSVRMPRLKPYPIKAFDQYLSNGTDSKLWRLLSIRYIAMSTKNLEHNTTNGIMSPTSYMFNEEYSVDKKRNHLLWHGLQLTILSYQPSKDFDLELSGLVYLGKTLEKASQSCEPSRSSVETEVETEPGEPIVVTPVASCSHQDDDPIYDTSKIWRDVATKDSLRAKTPSRSNSPNPKVNNSTELAWNDEANSNTTNCNDRVAEDSPRIKTPSRSNSPYPKGNNSTETTWNNEAKQAEQASSFNLSRYIGVGTTVSLKHTFLHPLPQCKIYWFPSTTLLYSTFCDGITPMLSFSIGVGMRWIVNTKLTLDLSSEKIIKAYMNQQDHLYVVKLGCQYTVG